MEANTTVASISAEGNLAVSCACFCLACVQKAWADSTLFVATHGNTLERTTPHNGCYRKSDTTKSSKPCLLLLIDSGMENGRPSHLTSTYVHIQRHTLATTMNVLMQTVTNIIARSTSFEHTSPKCTASHQGGQERWQLLRIFSVSINHFLCLFSYNIFTA